MKRDPTPKELIEARVNERVVALNRLYGRTVDDIDFVFHMMPQERLVGNIVTLSVGQPPLANTGQCAWIAIKISNATYLFRRDVCMSMWRGNGEDIKMNVSFMIKMTPLCPEPGYASLLHETNTIKEMMVEMETEIVNLRQVNDTLSNELKRKRDHIVVEDPVPIVDNNIVPVEMKKCTACQNESPHSTFTERNKKKNTKGEIKIYYPVRNTCRACRRQKYTATKKTKIDA